MHRDRGLGAVQAQVGSLKGLVRLLQSLRQRSGRGLAPQRRTMLLSLLIVLVTGVGLIVLVWTIFSVFPVVNRVVIRWFWCRFRQRNVSAEFAEDAWNGRPIDVTRCSAFEPPSAISCAKDCLHLPRLDPARPSKADLDAVAQEFLGPQAGPPI